jgi:transcriptional/translational regulatory protein YebC/TACO1
MDVSGKVAEQTVRLFDILDDLDDVQSVYMNAEISDAELAALSS